MITVIDMAQTFIKKEYDKKCEEFPKDKSYYIKIYTIVNIYLNNLSKKFDRDFFEDIKKPKKYEFENYINYFVENSNQTLFQYIDSSPENQYFISLVERELDKYLNLFRKKYDKETLLKLFNLKNKRRESITQ